MSSNNPSSLRWVLPTTVFVLLLSAAYLWLHGRPSNFPPASADPAKSGASRNSQPQKAPSQSQTSVLARAKKQDVLPDGAVSIPARFQLPGVRVAKSGVSFKDWLAQYPADQQGKIQAFDKKFYGVYSVNSREQVAWLAQNGYPLPEDIVAAERLSDGYLRELARQGNEKAGFLLRERNIAETKTKLDAYRAQGRTDADFWDNDPDAQQLRLDALETTRLLQQSHSPFKGYVQAADALQIDDPVGREAAVIAGLEWASSLGDFRASQFLDAYVGTDPVRAAMLNAANAVNINAGTDKMLMQSEGCQNPGVAPGQFVPGSFAPVE